MYKYFLITYDLLTPGKNYYYLYEGIKALAVDYRKIQNAWFIKSSSGAGRIRDALQQHVDGNDKLFVCEIGDWAGYNIGEVGRFLNGTA